MATSASCFAIAVIFLLLSHSVSAQLFNPQTNRLGAGDATAIIIPIALLLYLLAVLPALLGSSWLIYRNGDNTILTTTTTRRSTTPMEIQTTTTEATTTPEVWIPPA
ncbi:uncharacterized protein LOC111127546 isoform X2 [Crassostrea virginica]